MVLMAQTGATTTHAATIITMAAAMANKMVIVVAAAMAAVNAILTMKTLALNNAVILLTSATRI